MIWFPYFGSHRPVDLLPSVRHHWLLLYVLVVAGRHHPWPLFFVAARCLLDDNLVVTGHHRSSVATAALATLFSSRTIVNVLGLLFSTGSCRCFLPVGWPSRSPPLHGCWCWCWFGFDDDTINTIMLSSNGHVYTGIADRKIMVWRKHDREN